MALFSSYWGLGETIHAGPTPGEVHGLEGFLNRRATHLFGRNALLTTYFGQSVQGPGRTGFPELLFAMQR